MPPRLLMDKQVKIFISICRQLFHLRLSLYISICRYYILTEARAADFERKGVACFSEDSGTDPILSTVNRAR
jgi:hypothetical protein